MAKSRGFNFLHKITGESLRATKEQDLAESVRENLLLLLNTRQGMTTHLPDYGLPDVHRVFQTLPRSLDELAVELEHVLGKFEPRLRNVVVRRKETAQDTFRVTYTITGEIRQGSTVSKLTFRTEVMRDGAVETKKAGFQND